MAGKAIGTTLPFGYRGNVSRTPDTVIQSYTNVGTDNIPYGAAVIYDATNKGVRAVKSTDSTASDLIGIAVRHIGQPKADAPTGWYYAPGEAVDVLVRGSCTVELKATTGIAPRGQVYVDPTDGELTSVSTSNLALPNTKFSTGEYDGAKIAEVSILARSI